MSSHKSTPVQMCSWALSMTKALSGFQSEYGRAPPCLMRVGVNRNPLCLASLSGSGCVTAVSLATEAPVLFKKKLEPQTVEEWGSVTMVVELTRPWPEVKWTRNAMVLAPGKKVEIHTEGTSHSLVLHSVGFADRGFYGCETPDDKTQAKLTVESELQGSCAWGPAPRMEEGGVEGMRGAGFPLETFPGKGMEREGGVDHQLGGAL